MSGPTFESMARPLRLAALLVVLAALAGCGGGEGTSVAGEALSFEQLAKAATSSADASAARFDFSMDMTFPGADEPFAFSGSGAFDTTSNRASLTFDFSSFAKLLGGLLGGLGSTSGTDDLPDFGNPDLWQIEAVQDDQVMYMRFPAMSGDLPAGKSWVRMDLGEAVGEHGGFDFSQFQQFTNTDPRKMLDVLEVVSGEIETVGIEDLRGVETTHYRANVDLREYDELVPPAHREKARSMLNELVESAGLGEMPVDVWLDDSGLVRKLTMSFSATQPGTSDSAEVAMSFELYDYGSEIDIELPPRAAVVDAAALD